jgi:hypothetical protein
MSKRDPVALWRALQEQAMEDELAEIEAMSDEELDAHIRANGGDPEAIRASGAAFVKELLAAREANAWRQAVAKKNEAARAIVDEKKKGPKLSRDELLSRLRRARNDPRFAEPVAALFHGKSEQASTDEELQALIDQIELLAKLDEED